MILFVFIANTILLIVMEEFKLKSIALCIFQNPFVSIIQAFKCTLFTATEWKMQDAFHKSRFCCDCTACKSTKIHKNWIANGLLLNFYTIPIQCHITKKCNQVLASDLLIHGLWPWIYDGLKASYSNRLH